MKTGYERTTTGIMAETSSHTTQLQNIVSGVQPSGDLHLGNYLGALRNFVDLQEKFTCFYSIVDLHAITVWQDPEHLAHQTRSIAAAFLAAGLDPDRAVLFAQSSVPQHTELAWFLNCVARIGWLSRMTQFKEKAGTHRERASVGLYTYPVLQAADILLYKASFVPVGEDQKQHLELARDIAQKFNHDFKNPDFFPLPEPLIEKTGARVMSLRDGQKKMSKSDPSDLSRLNLCDDPDTLVKKIRKAKTDAEPLPESLQELKTRPEADNLVHLYASLTRQSPQNVLDQFSGQGFAVFKPALAERVVEVLAPLGQAMKGFMRDPAELDRILKKGGLKARATAQPVMDEVKHLMGFGKF